MRREHVVNSVLALSLAIGVVAALGWTSAKPGRSAATHTNDQPTAPALDAAVENLWLAPSDSEAGGGRGAPPIWSGGRPMGDAAFDALAHAGVEVIISVDGAKTDVDRAEARGMRYVHVPIGYHGLSDEQQLLVAKALRDAEGPVYIHCHHGKHRGPAAAAAALVRLGQLTPENAETWMARVGTSPKYSGLYTGVREATPATDEAITASGELVAQSKVNDMASAMVELETRLDHLIACQTAGDASEWPAPPDHPDLVPVAEAARIADVFRELSERRAEIGDPASTRRSPERAEAAARHYWRLMERGAERASELEAVLLAEPFDAKAADKALRRVSSSCFNCHMTFRD